MEDGGGSHNVVSLMRMNYSPYMVLASERPMDVGLLFASQLLALDA